MSSTRATAQICFPGMESWGPKRSWSPHQPTLEKLKSYLLGFPAHGKTIFPKRRYIADKLGIGVRTLARYLKHLVDAGWLATIARKAHYAIRVIVQVVTGAAGPSRGPCIEVTAEKPHLSREVLRTEEVCSVPASPPSLPNKIIGVLQRAAERIRTARRPEAYRQSIISSELRLLRAAPIPANPAKPTELPPPNKADELKWSKDNFFGSYVHKLGLL